MKQLDTKQADKMMPLLQNGFRLFFLSAIVFAIVTMVSWTSQLYSHWQAPLALVSHTQWHAHEMIFGYAIAVISGFLLTAVQNWTGQITKNGKGLLLIFLFWFVARCLALYPYPQTIIFILISSVLFYVFLLLAILPPILKTKNNKQWGIISKVILLGGADILFLSIASGWISSEWASPVLLFSVYTVVGLILVMGSRVIPGFTKNGIEHSENIYDWPILVWLSMVLYLVFVVSDLMHWQLALLISGIFLAILNAIRLWGWHNREIWKKPLVWVLHVAIGFITLGILMRALNGSLQLLPFLSLHMMTYGGIALITSGMMARVILGHTGRSVFEPPEGLAWVFILLVLGALVRTVAPALWMDDYFLFIMISQFMWIGAFTLMLGFYFKALVSKRLDGRFG